MSKLFDRFDRLPDNIGCLIANTPAFRSPWHGVGDTIVYWRPASP